MIDNRNGNGLKQEGDKVRILETFKAIREDMKANIYYKSMSVLILYRIAHYFFSHGRVGKILGAPFIILHNLMSSWILGIEIPAKTKIGYPLIIMHGVGLVVNSEATLGSNIIIRQGCCIGNKIQRDGVISAAPTIGNNVEFGVNAQVLGPIRVANNVSIGAGAVVLKDCEEGGVYVGVPAQLISSRNHS
jgi:putative colanic acid biosynthesis acetyltransferase WcaB